MVLRHGGSGAGGFLAGKQVVPINYEAEVSQRLLEASYSNDLQSAIECLADPLVDVNYVGALCLKIPKAFLLFRDESPTQVSFHYADLPTEATPLFVAATHGNSPLLRKLLSAGAHVNLRLFWGFATTAAAREGHYEILEILLKAGASQPACEEALLEVCSHGYSQLVELLMKSDLIRPHAAIHALVTACCRGFTEVVDTLMKCGVDANAASRILLQSLKPSLHTNADCTAIVAATVYRQISVVHLLMRAGVSTDVNVQLGAWSWDIATGEEFRVGAGMAEPYPLTWCAVEYFEATGSILQILLEHTSLDTPHNGRTLLHHAVLCNNNGAVKTLVKCGVDLETPVRTIRNNDFRAIHMATRLGLPTILQTLIDSGCDLNSRTENGETALMISVRNKREDCLQVLAKAGADFGLVSKNCESVCSIARSNRWYIGFQNALLKVIREGTVPVSTNSDVFASLLFVAESGDVVGLKALMGSSDDIELDEQDGRGFSAVMVAAKEGHVDAFRSLVYAGADVRLCNKSGESAMTLSKNRFAFEKVMLEFALEKGNRIGGGGFYALHCAARCGDLDAVKLLTSKGYDVNASDGDGYTPLMLAAKEANAEMCRLLLLSCGARVGMKNAKGESALSLVKETLNKEAENEILNALGRETVLSGSHVQKHTKGGKGAPHGKFLKMVGSEGILSWGKSSCRNVICQEAEVGPSESFVRNKGRKGDGMFHVRTSKDKEVHFVVDGGKEMAELWVRGIRVVTEEANLGSQQM
ncbi:Unknown protein [Striga hermonthica]|uniref:Uncharacterized protein n=1 Tax=Striga hermonthica TaxID=68872 RepID=A0A9N7R8A7_STRHE|nr:Unknown protein [Striga hermonthica]